MLLFHVTILLCSLWFCMSEKVFKTKASKDLDEYLNLDLQFDVDGKNIGTPINPELMTLKAKQISPKHTKVEFQIEERSDSGEDVTNRPKNKKRPTKKRKPKPLPCPEDEDDDEDDSEEDEEIVDSTGKKPSKSKNRKHTAGPTGKVFFEETFSERTWDTAWIYSKMEYGDKEKKKYEKFYRIRTKRGKKGFDYGLVTSNKGSEEYLISTSPFHPINSNDGPLVIQFSLQYQSVPHCEYIYLRLFDCSKFKPEEFTPESPYLIQIGPNICGNDKHLSVVIADPVKGEKYVVSDKKLVAITSIDVHTYSLIIQPDGNYQIMMNDKSVQNGSLTSSVPNYQGFASICSVGLNIWHSVLDKFFKGQIIVDDILIASDESYAERKRFEILDIMDKNANSTTSKS